MLTMQNSSMKRPLTTSDVHDSSMEVFFIPLNHKEKSIFSCSGVEQRRYRFIVNI